MLEIDRCFPLPHKGIEAGLQMTHDHGRGILEYPSIKLFAVEVVLNYKIAIELSRFCHFGDSLRVVEGEGG